jgi:hypothetical protein
MKGSHARRRGWQHWLLMEMVFNMVVLFGLGVAVNLVDERHVELAFLSWCFATIVVNIGSILVLAIDDSLSSRRYV